MGIPTTEVEEEAEEEDKQWIGMKGIQQKGLGEVMHEDSIEMKGITGLECGQILKVKGDRGMILICIPLQPKADTREIYHLHSLPYQKMDSLWIGVVRVQDLHMKGHGYRRFQ